jgi:NAD(P)H dehydrogenase (quinone)
MNIVLTGSLGNISKPLAQELIAGGHFVIVISSNVEKQKDIEALGAKAAIGKLEDGAFLSNTFAGADAVYCMIPMNMHEKYFRKYMQNTANTYVQAIKQAGIKRVVVLSGWSADLIKGENIEEIFTGQLDASICILRPGAFYTNFYFSMDLIKGKGLIGKYLTLRYSGMGALLTGKTGLLMGNYGEEDKIVFVSPKDIATAAAEELVNPSDEKLKIRYVGSEELTCNEAAKIIGTSIGKPWLKWVRISDKQMMQGLKMAKMPKELAENMVEMQSVMHSGKPLRNFHANNPKMGKVKLTDFAKEFAAVYRQK